MVGPERKGVDPSPSPDNQDARHPEGEKQESLDVHVPILHEFDRSHHVAGRSAPSHAAAPEATLRFSSAISSRRQSGIEAMPAWPISGMTIETTTAVPAPSSKARLRRRT